MKLKPLALALLALLFSLSAAANTDAVTNRIAFSVEAEQEVEHDLLQVTLFYQGEGNDLSSLNKVLNERLSKAVAAAKKQSAVEIRSNARNTQVRYNQQGKQNGWTDRGEITLQSRDFATLSNVIAELDGVMAVERTQAMVSSEKLAGLENQLTEDVLNKFKAKAEFIQKSLNMKGYRIINLDLSSAREESAGRPYLLRAKAVNYAMAAESDSAYAESGKEKVKTRVNAQIELRNP